jgi:hypothetical protein
MGAPPSLQCVRSLARLHGGWLGVILTANKNDLSNTGVATLMSPWLAG